MTAETRTCATCAHARRVVAPMQVQTALECHGAPPTAIIARDIATGQAVTVSAFPPVDPTSSCGMWKPAPPVVVTTNPGGKAA